MSEASSRAVGNHDWLGQYGHTKISVALSCLIFVRQSFMRENAGKAYPLRPSQLNERASVSVAPGWGFQLENAFSWAFQWDANKSIAPYHLFRIS